MKVDEGDTAGPRATATTTTTTIREKEGEWDGDRLAEALRQLGDVHVQVG